MAGGWWDRIYSFYLGRDSAQYLIVEPVVAFEAEEAVRDVMGLQAGNIPRSHLCIYGVYYT